MRFMKTQLLATCLALGCGSAMGSPNYDQPQPQGQYQGPPGQYQDQNQNEPQQQPMQQQQQPIQQQQPQQPYQQQQQPQANNDTNNDEDAVVDEFSWSSGGKHLGVLLEGMTQDLRAFFGAPSDRGVLVAHVEQGSPAQQAGVRVGDVILRVGHHRITSSDDVLSALSETQKTQIPLEVLRNGQHMRLQAMLEPNQQPQQTPQNPML